MRTTPMNLLALDTSTRFIGLAISDDNQILYESVWSSPDYHTVELAPAVETALQKAGGSVEKLAAIAVAIGPGSFTGLRIGLALAKGMCLIRNIPLIGIPTLDGLIAAQSVCDCELLAILRAGRGRLIGTLCQVVDGVWQSDQNLRVFTLGELAQEIKTATLICGELTIAERELLSEHPYIKLASPAQSLRRPAFLAQIAWKRFHDSLFDDPASLAPHYLHYQDPTPV